MGTNAKTAAKSQPELTPKPQRNQTLYEHWGTHFPVQPQPKRTPKPGQNRSEPTDGTNAKTVALPQPERTPKPQRNHSRNKRRNRSETTAATNAKTAAKP